MMNKFLALMFVFAVGCGSASSKEGVKTEPTSSSSGSGSGSSETTVVDSGSDTTTTSSSGSGSGSSSVTPPVVVDAGHDAGQPAEVDSGHVVVVDAGHVDAGHDAGSCALPSGTYNYVFTNVTANCDNTLASYMVGPVPLGSVDLSTMLPSFCDQSGDTPVVSAATASSNGCSAAATTTCSDPVHATVPDGGSDPLTIVSVATVDANATASALSGTLSLTTTDEISKASCTQTYTWKATN